MSVFLLVHGGSHGKWCWESVVDELATLGHVALTFDLPGHGDDHTPRETVTRQSYIKATCHFIEQHNLEDVILVGHSLAGAVLPDIWQQQQTRINRVIFLAAYVLRSSEMPIDLVPKDRRPSYYELVSQSNDNSFLLSVEKARALFFSDLSDDDAAYFYKKLTPQPFGVYLDACVQAPQLPKTQTRYIQCAFDKVIPPDLALHCAEALGVNVEVIEAGHDAMLSQPKALAKLLSDICYHELS